MCIPQTSKIGNFFYIEKNIYKAKYSMEETGSLLY